MILLDATSTIINPKAMARQVTRRTIISLYAKTVALLTHPYIMYYRFGPGISGNTDAVRKMVDGALLTRDMINA